MQDGVVVLSASGDVLLSNHAAEPLLKVFGAHPDSAYSDSRRDCKAYADISTHCRACLSDLHAGARSCLLDIDKRVIEVHATPLAMAGADGTGRILVGRDVTDRIARDEREIHQERLAVLGEVAAVMAHELNNPLASISMFNQMMTDTLDEGHPMRENTEVIARNTETCKRVIAELLGYAADSGTESSLTDLHVVLQDVARFLRPLADRSNVNIELQLEAQSSMVEGDDVQLRQVFVNLVMNAIQAIEGSGRVLVCTIEDGAKIWIDVIDSGAGISATAQGEIFRPFFTTKPRGEGTGLGLPTAKRIAELHGGGLELVKSSESGTHFRVRLKNVGIEA
jgi:signal transduction histidine kinase